MSTYPLSKEEILKVYETELGMPSAKARLLVSICDALTDVLVPAFKEATRERIASTLFELFLGTNGQDPLLTVFRNRIKTVTARPVPGNFVEIRVILRVPGRGIQGGSVEFDSHQSWFKQVEEYITYPDRLLFPLEQECLCVASETPGKGCRRCGGTTNWKALFALENAEEIMQRISTKLSAATGN